MKNRIALGFLRVLDKWYVVAGLSADYGDWFGAVNVATDSQNFVWVAPPCEVWHFRAEKSAFLDIPKEPHNVTRMGFSARYYSSPLARLAVLIPYFESNRIHDSLLDQNLFPPTIKKKIVHCKFSATNLTWLNPACEEQSIANSSRQNVKKRLVKRMLLLGPYLIFSNHCKLVRIQFESLFHDFEQKTLGEVVRRETPHPVRA